MSTTHQGAEGAETMPAGQTTADRLNWLQGLAQSELRKALGRRKHLPPQIVTSAIVNEISAEIRAAIDRHQPGQYTTWVRGTHLGDMQVTVGVPSWPDEATPAPRTDGGMTAGEILTAACKPWEHYTGEPPDDGSPLSGVFVAGMAYTERLLAKLLDVTHYEGGDGSEDFDRDATQTLRNILTGARLWDADENCPVSATPAQPAGAVPESLRALMGKAHNAPHSAKGALDEAGRREKVPGRSLKLYGAAEECEQAIFSIADILASHPAGQSAGSGAGDEAVWPEQYGRLADGYGPIEEWRDWTIRSGLEPMSNAALHALRGMIGEFASDAIKDALQTAPDSTRTGQGEETVAVPTEPTEAMVFAGYDATRKPDGTPQFADAGFCLGHAADIYAAMIAARPAAPEAQGSWSFDMEAAPRDGTVILLWREAWGEPSAAYWGLAPMAAGAGIADKRHPWVFLDSTNGVNGYSDGEHGPTAWHPMLDAPAPPASSGQGGR